MNGQIISGTCIAVDFWKIRGVQDQLIHFLTHLHGDHIVGLTSSWTRTIYCSEFTAQLLEAHYGVSKKVMNILHVNQCTLVQLPNSAESFCVTAYDANHCPGALMLYFEGTFGNIFYTGDFRFSKEMMNESLQPLIGKIDKLYIDNTFCDQHCAFPPREECQRKITDIAKEHPDSDILIGIRKLGKESMLALLGVELDETIFVSPERFQISQCLFDCNVFAVASKDQHARIRTLPLHNITREFIWNKNQNTPTVAIMPTAIFTGLKCKPFSRDPSIFVVPYSDHSSFPELVEFVKKLQPRRIVPIVTRHRGPFGQDISNRSDMAVLESYIQQSADEKSPQSQRTQSVVYEEDNCDDGHSQNNCCRKYSDSITSFSQTTIINKSCGKKYLTAKSHLSSYSYESLLSVPPPTTSLKRKMSIPDKRKKKLAKGVVFEGDSGEQRSASENKSDSHINPQTATTNTAVENVELDSTSTTLTSGHKREDVIETQSCSVSEKALNRIDTLQSVHQENMLNVGYGSDSNSNSAGTLSLNQKGGDSHAVVNNGEHFQSQSIANENVVSLKLNQKGESESTCCVSDKVVDNGQIFLSAVNENAVPNGASCTRGNSDQQESLGEQCNDDKAPEDVANSQDVVNDKCSLSLPECLSSEDKKNIENLIALDEIGTDSPELSVKVNEREGGTDSCRVILNVRNQNKSLDFDTRNPMKRTDGTELNSNSSESENSLLFLSKCSVQELDIVVDELNNENSHELNSEVVKRKAITNSSDSMKRMKACGEDTINHQKDEPLNVNSEVVIGCQSENSKCGRIANSRDRIEVVNASKPTESPTGTTTKSFFTRLSSKDENIEKETFSVRQLFQKRKSRHCNEKAFRDAVAKLL